MYGCKEKKHHLHPPPDLRVEEVQGRPREVLQQQLQAPAGSSMKLLNFIKKNIKKLYTFIHPING